MSLTLLFKAGGQVTLLEDDGRGGEETLWASDDDEGFQEEFGNEFMDPDEAEQVLEYLVDEDIVTESEAGDILIESDSLEDVNDEEPAAEASDVIEGEVL